MSLTLTEYVPSSVVVRKKKLNKFKQESQEFQEFQEFQFLKLFCPSGNEPRIDSQKAREQKLTEKSLQQKNRPLSGFRIEGEMKNYEK